MGLWIKTILRFLNLFVTFDVDESVMMTNHGVKSDRRKRSKREQVKSRFRFWTAIVSPVLLLLLFFFFLLRGVVMDNRGCSVRFWSEVFLCDCEVEGERCLKVVEGCSSKKLVLKRDVKGGLKMELWIYQLPILRKFG